jgi:hypothetical protein
MNEPPNYVVCILVLKNHITSSAGDQFFTTHQFTQKVQVTLNQSDQNLALAEIRVHFLGFLVND